MYKLAAILIRNRGLFRPQGIVCRLGSTASQQPYWGSGVGKGGGAGGSVRELGGAFGQREAAEEEVYFRRLTAQQLEDLHNLHMGEIRNLEKEMKEHAATIQLHKQKLRSLKKLSEGKEHESVGF